MKGYILRCAKCNEPIWSVIPLSTYLSAIDERKGMVIPENLPPYYRFDYCPSCKRLNPITKAEFIEVEET